MLSKVDYDPERVPLAEAGFPDGLSEVTIAEDITDADGNVVFKAGDKMPLRLYYMPVTRFYFPAPKELGEALAADLANAGINVEMYLEGDWPTYLGSRANGALVGLYMLGWGGDNGDPDNFTGYFFGRLPRRMPSKNRSFEGLLKSELALLYNAAVNPDPAAMRCTNSRANMHDDVARLARHNTPLPSANVNGYIPQPVGVITTSLSSSVEGLMLTYLR
jgi:peptide/nickel transport system substrate-binding protein